MLFEKVTIFSNTFKSISFQQGLGKEKDGDRSKFISSNVVIFCYKEFEKFALCKSLSQSEVI